MQTILSLSQWETRVAHMYASARAFKSTHAELLEMRQKRIYSELTRKHGKRAVYSSYVAGYVAGLMRGEDAQIYRWHLEYCYKDAAGVLYSTHRESTHRRTEEFYASGRGCELGTLESGHYWKGTEKPFYSAKG